MDVELSDICQVKEVSLEWIGYLEVNFRLGFFFDIARQLKPQPPSSNCFSVTSSALQFSARISDSPIISGTILSRTWMQSKRRVCAIHSCRVLQCVLCNRNSLLHLEVEILISQIKGTPEGIKVRSTGIKDL